MPFSLTLPHFDSADLPSRAFCDYNMRHAIDAAASRAPTPRHADARRRRDDDAALPPRFDADTRLAFAIRGRCARCNTNAYGARAEVAWRNKAAAG